MHLDESQLWCHIVLLPSEDLTEKIRHHFQALCKIFICCRIISLSALLLTPKDAAPVAVYLGNVVGWALKSDYVVIRIQD